MLNSGPQISPHHVSKIRTKGVADQKAASERAAPRDAAP